MFIHFTKRDYPTLADLPAPLYDDHARTPSCASQSPPVDDGRRSYFCTRTAEHAGLHEAGLTDAPPVRHVAARWDDLHWAIGSDIAFEVGAL